MNKISLVLEGGGMRGVFTSGVLDYFLEANISFDSVIGVSAGALNATRFLSNQPKKNIEVTLDNLENKDYCSFKSLIKTGNMFGVDLLYNKIPRELVPLDNDYFKNSMVSFYCVVTNCITGKPEYINIKDFFKDMDYLRASSSLPMLSKLVMINNIPYLDGGISDSIPVKASFDLGCDKCIVVLTQPDGYVKKQTKTYNVVKRAYKKYPKMCESVRLRHNNYNESLKYLSNNKNCFVIRPSENLNIGRTEKNREKIINAYNLGYDTAKKIHKDLIKFIEKDA